MPKIRSGLRCTVCGGRIHITNTYAVCESIQTKKAVCTLCGELYAVKTEIIRRVTGRGEGAAAEAAKLRRKHYGIPDE